MLSHIRIPSNNLARKYKTLMRSFLTTCLSQKTVCENVPYFRKLETANPLSSSQIAVRRSPPSSRSTTTVTRVMCTYYANTRAYISGVIIGHAKGSAPVLCGHGGRGGGGDIYLQSERHAREAATVANSIKQYLREK